MKKVIRSIAITINNQPANLNLDLASGLAVVIGSQCGPITMTFVLHHYRDHLFDFSVPIENLDLCGQIILAIEEPFYRLRSDYPEFRETVGIIAILHCQPLTSAPVIASEPELRKLVEELTESVNRAVFDWEQQQQQEETRKWLQEADDKPFDGFLEAEADRRGY